MEVYDFSHIVEINKDGLEYLDSEGSRKFIDFDECRRNWVQYVNESGKFTTWEGEPYKDITENDTTCVGQRDWFADKPYFEFFTVPIIRFELIPKRRIWEIFMKHWVHRYYKDFHNIQMRIDDSGWSTFDLG